MTDVVILGVFVADLAFQAPRMPMNGETILGQGFRMGPGGKGSNQAVAAAMAGGRTRFLTRLGQDAFGEMARQTWAKAGVDASSVIADIDRPTGAAFIFVSTETGQNAIIVEPGAAGALSVADIASCASVIREAKVFMCQLEQPMPVAAAALGFARAAGVLTVLNPAPAPAAVLEPGLLALCDYVTPNEIEASGLTGLPVTTLAEARAAAAGLMAQGARAVIITLGDNGALFQDAVMSEHVPAFRAGKAIDTSGAGDAFSGAFAVAIAEGQPPLQAVRFGCAAAGISVTRPGTAPSMPSRIEIEALLRMSA